MDKEEAIMVLAKELSSRTKRKPVFEEWLKENLIRNCSAFCQVGEPVFVDLPAEIYSDEDVAVIVADKVLPQNPCFKHANYFFLTSRHTMGDTRYSCSQESPYVVTSLALLGNKDEQELKKLFYKDVPDEVSRAMARMDIKNYITLYKSYVNQPPGYSSDSFLEFIKIFLDFASMKKYDSQNERTIRDFDNIGGIDLLNTQLQEIGIKNHISTTEYREESTIKSHPKYVHKKNMDDIVNEIEMEFGSGNGIESGYPLLSSFYNFVFALPYEEQNIEANKHILNSCQNIPGLDYLKIMTDEYSKDKYFQEYFDSLGGEQQQKVVRCLQAAEQERNIAHDSFLWSKGFNEISLDYMQLYKKDASEFIEYFSSKQPKEKKIILKDIMGCDYTNKEVAEWLDENELDLLREVSMYE